MDMKTKAVHQAAYTKIENALKEVNDPVIELSLVSTMLSITALKRSGGDWDKALKIIDFAAQTCRKSVENAQKVFGDKAFKQK